MAVIAPGTVTNARPPATAANGSFACMLLLAASVVCATAPRAHAAADSSRAASEIANLPDDCFAELENGNGAEIACLFPLRLSETEQAELEKGSRGYVKNVVCTMTIRIPRADVERAMTARDLEFKSPEQPVSCTVTTYKSTFDITGTFAPRVEFKNDVAVEASPGLANVEGISRVISWPVVQFVNRWPSIRKGLLQIVNAYRAYARKKGASSAK